MISKFNKNNFHNYTFCVWNQVDLDEIKNLKISFKSKSGSAYIITKNGVFRISNHWGRVANCRWKLQSSTNYKNQNTVIGFANWNDFYQIDDTSKLYFIKVNFDEKSVDYLHKDSNLYDQKAIVRTAIETSKIIKIITVLLKETSWAKHLVFQDFDQFQKEIINELIYTDKTFIEIKRKFLQ